MQREPVVLIAIAGLQRDQRAFSKYGRDFDRRARGIRHLLQFGRKRGQRRLERHAQTDTWQSLIDSGRWLVALKTFRITMTITLIELALAPPFAL